jgi:hypothetical protein
MHTCLDYPHVLCKVCVHDRMKADDLDPPPTLRSPQSGPLSERDRDRSEQLIEEISPSTMRLPK